MFLRIISQLGEYKFKIPGISLHLKVQGSLELHVKFVTLTHLWGK